MPTITLPTLKKFLGNRVDLHITFLPAILNAARIASSYPNQIAYDLMSPQERAAAPAHEDIPNPGPTPAANSTDHEFKVWTEQRNRYNEYNAERNTFLAWIISAIPEDVKVTLARPPATLASLSARQIVDGLINVYGPIQATDLESQIAKMRAPLQLGAPIEEFLSVHVMAHHVHDMARSTLAECTKVQYLKEAASLCEAYVPCVQQFNHDFRNPAQQTYNALASALRDYVVATKYNTPQALVAAQAQVQIQTQHPKPVKASRVRAPTKYCWTHGTCFHTGAECTNPADHHQSGATLTNKMGGSNYVAKSRKSGGKPPRANQ